MPKLPKTFWNNDHDFIYDFLHLLIIFWPFAGSGWEPLIYIINLVSLLNSTVFYQIFSYFQSLLEKLCQSLLWLPLKNKTSKNIMLNNKNRQIPKQNTKTNLIVMCLWRSPPLFYFWGRGLYEGKSIWGPFSVLILLGNWNCMVQSLF